MEEWVRTVGKEPVNDLSLETLEHLLTEELEAQDLFNCGFNWLCDQNNSK
ncbi:MAG: hypothetical protein AB2385_11040 [Symbiobacterium sp.]|jgi:hypothetical protein